MYLCILCTICPCIPLCADKAMCNAYKLCFKTTRYICVQTNKAMFQDITLYICADKAMCQDNTL